MTVSSAAKKKETAQHQSDELKQLIAVQSQQIAGLAQQVSLLEQSIRRLEITSKQRPSRVYTEAEVLGLLHLLGIQRDALVSALEQLRSSGK